MIKRKQDNQLSSYAAPDEAKVFIGPPVELWAAHEYSGCASVIRSHTPPLCLPD